MAMLGKKVRDSLWLNAIRYLSWVTWESMLVIVSNQVIGF